MTTYTHKKWNRFYQVLSKDRLKLKSGFLRKSYLKSCHGWEISQEICVSTILALMPMINICAFSLLLEVYECLLEGPKRLQIISSSSEQMAQNQIIEVTTRAGKFRKWISEIIN